MTLDTVARQHVTLDPGVRSFLDQVAEAGLSPYAPGGFDRGADIAARLQGDAPLDTTPVTRITLVEGASEFSLILAHPPGVGTVPVLFYLPGGFWAFGGWATHGAAALRLAAGCGAALLFVEAGWAPPVLAPQALRRIHAALDWLIAHGAANGLDVERTVLAGDGCGGAMAALLATAARPAGWPGFRYQVLAHPIVADCAATEGVDDWLDPDAFRRCSARAFATGLGWAALSPLALPLERLRRSPPTLVLTAEADLARDGGRPTPAA